MYREYSRDACVLACYSCNNDKSYIFPKEDYKLFMGPSKNAYFSTSHSNYCSYINTMTMEHHLFPIISVIPSKNAILFVDNWTKMYNHPGYDRYEELLRLHAWRYDDLLELFTWKNGTPLSGKKGSRV